MQLRLFSLVMLLVSALVLSACGTQDITADEIVERMEDARDSLQDIHATVAIDFVTDERNGSMLIEGWLKKTEQVDADGEPVKKLRAEILEASEDRLVGTRLVSDGETFWVYNPDENKVLTGNKADMPDQPTTDPVGATEALRDMLEQGLDAFDIEVLGEEQIAGQETWKLALTPKTETEEQLQLDGLLTLTMWVDEELALPLKIEVDGSDMGQGTLEVRTLEVDTGLSDELFTFEIPAGAEVVDAAEVAEQMRPRSMTLDEAQAAVDFPLLVPTDLPGNATLIEVQVIAGETVIQNYVGGATTFSIVQSSNDVGADRQPPAGSEVQQVTLRGQEATLITGSGEQQGSLLRWEENGVRVVVAGTLSADEALRVAESLE